jgi:hypothetical protein
MGMFDRGRRFFNQKVDHSQTMGQTQNNIFLT